MHICLTVLGMHESPCMYVHTYVCTGACTHIHDYVYMYVHMYLCMHANTLAAHLVISTLSCHWTQMGLG